MSHYAQPQGTPGSYAQTALSGSWATFALLLSPSLRPIEMDHRVLSNWRGDRGFDTPVPSYPYPGAFPCAGGRAQQSLTLESGCSSMLRVGVGDGLIPGIYCPRVIGGFTVSQSKSSPTSPQQVSLPLPPLALSSLSPSRTSIWSRPVFPYTLSSSAAVTAK